MNNDNKVIMSALLILGISLFSFNIGTFTGKAGYRGDCKQSDAKIDDNILEAGDKIRVTVSSPSKGAFEGVYNQAKVYRVTGNGEERVGGVTLTNICENSQYKCYSTQFDIQTISLDQNPIWRPGRYVVKIKDVCADDFVVEAPFIIK